MMETQFDVLVVGAGAAGMMAALELARTGRRVGILEAKNRSGGRMHTVYSRDGQWVELGAEFVHGDLPLTKGLLEKAGAKLVPVRGTVWQSRGGVLRKQDDFIESEGELEGKLKELHEDLPVADFLQKCLPGDQHEALRRSLTNYVQGYYAADLSQASTFALREELQKGEDEQFRIEGGYQKLVDYLEAQCRVHGVDFFFSEAVQTVRWQQNRAEATTPSGTYSAARILVTVPLGVLQAEAINFTPALPQKMEAARRLGFGHVQKVVLPFETGFWNDKADTQGKDLHNAGFLFSDEQIPTWWTQYPEVRPVLTGWLGGPPAISFGGFEKEVVAQKAIHSLGLIFGLDVVHLAGMAQAAHWYNWSTDPYFRGAYSYEVVNGEAAMKTLLEAEDDTVYFAGEGLHGGPQIGTVEAALASGRDAAHRMIAAF